MRLISIKNRQIVAVREAGREDSHNLLTFLHKTGGESDFLTFGPGELPVLAKDMEAFLEESIKAKNRIMMLALVEGKVIGSLYFAGGAKIRIQHTGEFGVSVLKDYWGQGIGTAMVEELIQWAKASGVIRKLNLRVRSDNEKAINLYNKIGFNHEGLISREFLISGKFFDCYCMGLKID